MAANAFEARNRALKVNKLVSHIAALVATCGYHAERDGQAIAEVLRAWEDKHWNAACIGIGMQSRGNKPLCSWLTRREVIARFQNAQKARAS